MDPDRHVCLCFRVSLRKVVNYYKRERPVVASLINRELPAGTGCQWCVPYLERLHRQVMAGEAPSLPVDPQSYASKRASYRQTGLREGSRDVGDAAGAETGQGTGDARETRR